MANECSTPESEYPFNWPLNKVWEGFLNPHYDGHRFKCEECGGSGNSPEAQHLHDLWYGHASFHPSQTGSEPFAWDHPVVLAFAKRNCESAPDYYGSSDFSVQYEARRLARLFNSRWCHHLDADDVAALMEADRLWDFTRTPRNEEQKALPAHENGWLKESNGYMPTPREVNEWSLCGLGHDSINSWIVIGAKAKRLGIETECSACAGSGSVWDSLENKAIAEAWEPSEPPTGDGWQMWETVTEGSPQTPVFATPEALVDHLVNVEGYQRESAERFIETEWAPSAVIQNGVFLSGVDALFPG